MIAKYDKKEDQVSVESKGTTIKLNFDQFSFLVDTLIEFKEKLEKIKF